MAQVTVKELLEAGVHFGHQTARWNPKMNPYIFAARNGIHIIDLQQTAEYANNVYKFVTESVALGAKVLFVGTKKQAQDVIQEQAERAGMFYVNRRWLGGMLTNFKTIKQSIDRLNTYYQRLEAGELENLPKKEVLTMSRKMGKLEHSLGGIKSMKKAPDIVFLVDPHKEHIAVREAGRLGLPIIALTDTNCNPDGIDYIIPGNDDAIRAITKVVSMVADACEEGLERREAVIRKEAQEDAKGKKKDAKAKVIDTKSTHTVKAYVAKGHEREEEAPVPEKAEAKVAETKPAETKEAETKETASTDK
jgi:small subunit ribosomal protein S2